MLRAGIREYVRLRARSRQGIGAQVDEEIELHLELRARDLMAEGWPAAAARAEAERRFGELESRRDALRRAAEERERRMTVREWLGGWRQDLGYSVRALAREPVLSLVIVLTLGLGIGANTTMFGIIDRLLLSGPTHVSEWEQLRRVYLTQKLRDGERTSATTRYVTYTLLRELTGVFDGVATYRYSEARIGRGQQARVEAVAESTADLFPLLGVTPALGRFYNAAEDRPKQAQRLAVLDWSYWQSAYGGSRDAVGRTLLIDDEEYRVIGVAPRGFTGPELQRASVWLPFGTGYVPRDDWPTTWNARWTRVLVRLAPDVPVDRAAAKAEAVYRAAAREEGLAEAAGARLTLLPPGYAVDGSEPAEVAISRWLVGVSVIVLFVACANVINLMLARGMRRRRELAVRLALGVTRARLVRLLLSESLLLAVAGGVLALIITSWAGQLLSAALLPDVAWGAALSTRVLLFSALVIVLAGILVGLAPALQAGRQDVTAMLAANQRGGGAARSRLRSTLTVLQAAFSLVLLVGAGLFARSLWNIHSIELGIDADRVLAVWTNFEPTGDLAPEQQAAESVRRAAFHEQAVERLRANPQVAAAAVAIGTPLQGMFGVDLRVPGRDSIPELPGGGPFVTAAGPGYFETVGTRVLRGRGIVAGDGRGSERVAIVNETMARTLWPDEDPLTKCIIVEHMPCARVVGIVEDAKRAGLRDEPAMQYYIPFGQERGIGGTHILVRPVRATASWIPELRRQLHALEPAANYFAIGTLQERLDPQIRPWRLGATMFLAFGGVALLIAAVGLYSLIAYSVAQRRIELGVRMALGARAHTIVTMVLRQGLALVLLGSGLGVLLALAAGRYLEPLLFDTPARDVPTFTAVTLILVGVAILASVIPAAHAGRTDPIEALRAE